jgi:hypothetical protein
MSWHIGAIVEPDDPLGRNVGLALEDDSIAGRRHDRLRWADERHSRRHCHSTTTNCKKTNQKINVFVYLSRFLSTAQHTKTVSV